MEMRIRNVPADLALRVKLASVRAGMSQQAVLMELVREYVKRDEAKHGRK